MSKRIYAILFPKQTQRLHSPSWHLSFGFWIVLLSLIGCEVSQEDLKSMKPFEGPTMKTFDLLTNYSDSGRIKIRVQAPLQLEYESGNQEFPKGIQVDFFNNKQEVYSKLTAKQAFYDKVKNEYTAVGNVIVENIANKEMLKTEELHWTPVKQEIYTDKFVVITTPKEILKGNGLVAAQDFGAYEIKKPTGVFSLPQK